jgi:oligopeptide transport system substrate-binding protein
VLYWEGIVVHRRGIVLAALLVIAALILAGCRTPSAVVERQVRVEVTVPVVETRMVERVVVVTATPAPTPAYTSRLNAPPGTLIYPLPQDPRTLDPQEATDETSRLVLQQLYEGLFNLRGDGSLAPAAATGHEVSPDGRLYTVRLRPALKWADGEPVTAQHYVEGFCRLLDPGTINPAARLFADVAPVRGAADYAAGNSVDCARVGIRAVTTATLQISLTRPAASLPWLLATLNALPVRAEHLGGARPIELPTNGPFRLVEWIPGDHVTLEKSSVYWNADAVKVPRIEFRVIAESPVQLARYQQGDLHLAALDLAQTAGAWTTQGLDREVRVLTRPGISYLGLNTLAGPTANADFRRAIASAIDREALLQGVLHQPWHLPARTLLPPGTFGYQGHRLDVGWSYDPQAARAYLVKAGYGPGKPAPVLEMWTNREGNNLPLFQAIGEMLEAVGIPTRLVTSSWDNYTGALSACRMGSHAGTVPATRTPAPCTYGLYRAGWIMEHADPLGLLGDVLGPASAMQYSGWQSEKYTALLAQAAGERDDERRADLYRQAELLLLQEAVFVPLQYYDRTILAKPGLKLEFAPFGPPSLQYWQLP